MTEVIGRFDRTRNRAGAAGASMKLSELITDYGITRLELDLAECCETTEQEV